MRVPTVCAFCCRYALCQIFLICRVVSVAEFGTGKDRDSHETFLFLQSPTLKRSSTIFIFTGPGLSTLTITRICRGT